jgi:chemotaxis protein CheZ
MDHAASLSTLPVPATPGDPVYRLIGQITRQLHDSLEQLGLMSNLQDAADGLTDARHRLNFIAEKSTAAAEKVLTLVDLAKAEHRCMGDALHEVQAQIATRAGTSDAPGSLLALLARMDEARARSDANLTEIMLAQDFHDLTGQVVVKVLALAGNLENSLVKLLLQTAPPKKASRSDPLVLNGPVVNSRAGDGVVTSQGEVDDLLASLGF